MTLRLRERHEQAPLDLEGIEHGDPLHPELTRRIGFAVEPMDRAAALDRPRLARDDAQGRDVRLPRTCGEDRDARRHPFHRSTTPQICRASKAIEMQRDLFAKAIRA